MSPLQSVKEVLLVKLELRHPKVVPFVKLELRILLILANLAEQSGLYGLIFAYACSSLELRFSYHYISALL